MRSALLIGWTLAGLIGALRLPKSSVRRLVTRQQRSVGRHLHRRVGELSPDLPTGSVFEFVRGRGSLQQLPEVLGGSREGLLVRVYGRHEGQRTTDGGPDRSAWAHSPWGRSPENLPEGQRAGLHPESTRFLDTPCRSL